MRSVRHLIVWLVIIAVGAAIAQIFQEARRGGTSPSDTSPSDTRRDETPAAPPPRTGDAIAGRPRVVDGDSLIIGTSRIRLFGIDAPEGRQDCRDAQGRNYRCGETSRRRRSVR